MKKLILLINLTLLGLSSLFSQIQLGEWNIHLPYYEGYQVTQSEDYIFCASKMGLFSYQKKDHAVETLTKINGLADVGISAINYNPFTDQLLIAYSNSNLDIIEGQGIINLPDIKNKIMTGDKRVYRIFFHNQKAFLACGFGIVILDMAAKEFTDTWLIGPDGGKLKIADFTVFQDSYYAATENGLYRIDTSNTFPANYANWERITIQSIQEEIEEVENFKDELFLVLKDETGNESLRKLSNGTWSIPTFNEDGDYNRLINQDSLLLVVKSHSLEAYDENDFRAYIIYNYSFGSPSMQSALADEKGHYWIADRYYGLVRSVLPWSSEQIIPNGPFRESAFDIAISDNQVWVTGGGKTPSYGQIYSNAGIYQYTNYTWTNFNYQLEKNIPSYLSDICEIIVDPMDSKRVFAGSWGYGLLEFYDNQLVEVHNDSNSTLQSIFAGSYVRIGGLAFDDANNLWVSNSKVDNILSCYTPDKEWIALPYGSTAAADLAGKILIDRNNYKWIILPRGEGLFILDDNGTPA
ncbi:MAG: hypothetical protein K9I34_05950, partial [Bacteroidales bacterium]|nr:hypothetical protein [Bacteroidales bacterium]